MPNTFREADRDNWDIYRTVNPIIQSWLGVTGKGVALTNTQVSDADKYAVDAANAGTGTKALRAVAGAHSLTVNSSGITLSSLTLSGNLTVGGTLTVAGATVLNGAVTLGDAAGDTITVTGTATFAQGTTFSSSIQVSGAAVLQSTLGVTGATTLAAVTASGAATLQSTLAVTSTTTLTGAVTCQSSLQVNGGAQVGDANTDNHFYIGKTTFQNALGTAKQLYVDAGNDRVIVGTDTALSSATDDKCAVVGGRLYLAPNSSQQALGLRYSSSVTGTYYIGATNSSTPSLILKDTSGDEVAAFGDAADTYQLYLTGTGRATANWYADKSAIGATALISTEKLYVNGNILTANTYGLYGRNAAGTALRNLISKDASDITEIGDANDATVRIRASTDVVFLLFGANELRVSSGGSQFGSPTGGYKGAGTVNAVAVYDDNTLLTDHLLDLYHDGAMRPDDIARFGDLRLYSIAETRAYTARERHLPSLPGRDEWAAGSKSLGEMVTRLWDTVERLQFHTYELHDRLAALEAR